MGGVSLASQHLRASAAYCVTEGSGGHRALSRHPDWSVRVLPTEPPDNPSGPTNTALTHFLAILHRPPMANIGQCPEWRRSNTGLMVNLSGRFMQLQWLRSSVGWIWLPESWYMRQNSSFSPGIESHKSTEGDQRVPGSAWINPWLRYSAALSYTALSCTALHCTKLLYTKLHCTALCWTTQRRPALICTSLHCNHQG